MNSNLLTEDDRLASAAIAEAAFHTADDPTQAQIKPGAGSWLRDHIPFCLQIIRYEKTVIGSTLIVPTSLQLMHRFLAAELNEAELFAEVMGTEVVHWQALYLCSAVLLPEHRGKGVATASAMQSIEWVLANHNPDPEFYAWPINAEGIHATHRMRLILAASGFNLRVRQ